MTERPKERERNSGAELDVDAEFATMMKRFDEKAKAAKHDLASLTKRALAEIDNLQQSCTQRMKTLHGDLKEYKVVVRSVHGSEKDNLAKLAFTFTANSRSTTSKALSRLKMLQSSLSSRQEDDSDED